MRSQREPFSLVPLLCLSQCQSVIAEHQRIVGPKPEGVPFRVQSAVEVESGEVHLAKIDPRVCIVGILLDCGLQ